jgi:hypothetical protein
LAHILMASALRGKRRHQTIFTNLSKFIIFPG